MSIFLTLHTYHTQVVASELPLEVIFNYKIQLNSSVVTVEKVRVRNFWI